MKSSEFDRQADELIGEAVLALLRGKGAINTQTLLAKLRAMEAGETDLQRREAIVRVINDVKEMATKRRRLKHELDERDQGNSEMPGSFFRDGQPQGKDNIH
ncbi:hypothetical protein MUA03_10625 [Enterobacteriaceae bacterium H16N7]|nr:hypothetical protein [Dryocola clanedunensis]